MQEIAQKSDILFLSQEDNENEFNEILSNEFSQYPPDEGIILVQMTEYILKMTSTP